MPKAVLQALGLTKRYGELVAVNNLSLEVYEGEVFGFLGPNGAGKTTSINMMCGLLSPDAGRVLVHGQPITGGAASVRTRVGICPQEIVLWSHLTCIEQLKFIGEMYGVDGQEARRRAERLLEELGLEEKRNKQARTLSGGLQRRLNLALALVHDPDIVALDEPEAGLDPQSRVAVRGYIKQLARSKTVILTTHNMDEADRLADQVAIIDHGELLVLDTPQALKLSIGEGDVLEVGLTGDETSQGKALSALAGLGDQAVVSATDGALHVRARNVVNLMPLIVESLEEAGIPFGEVRLRQNTLEDVFIHLTGRRLRE
jgi:ABC-2 type transport system ATP-binding protein